MDYLGDQLYEIWMYPDMPYIDSSKIIRLTHNDCGGIMIAKSWELVGMHWESKTENGVTTTTFVEETKPFTLPIARYTLLPFDGEEIGPYTYCYKFVNGKCDSF